jgi:GNAT superfamily N-acetyltransferase
MTYLSASFTEDELETTVHLVALSEDLPIGCVSLLIDRDKPSIQLRGMAVLTQQQGTGVGAKLLSEAYVIATKHEKSLWCNARQSAIKFYEKNGWTAYGPFFEIPIIGEHVAMQWKFIDYKRQRS